MKSMKKSILLLMVVIFFSCMCPAAGGRKVSLILAEFGKSAEGRQTQSLVRYRFQDGRLLSREVVLTRLTDEIRFEFGENLIWKRRFIMPHPVIV